MELIARTFTDQKGDVRGREVGIDGSHIIKMRGYTYTDETVEGIAVVMLSKGWNGRDMISVHKTVEGAQREAEERNSRLTDYEKHKDFYHYVAVQEVKE